MFLGGIYLDLPDLVLKFIALVVSYGTCFSNHYYIAWHNFHFRTVVMLSSQLFINCFRQVTEYYRV
jgi:hypothetical protein